MPGILNVKTMKKTVSLKLFSTVMWKGICQAVKWFAKLFGYQGTDCYLRVVWRILVGSFASISLVFTIAVVYCFVTGDVCENFVKWIDRRTSREVTDERYLSNHIVFQNIGYKGKTRIVNTLNGEVVMTGIDNVVTSNDGDSLAVFFKGKLRGYMNRFTGKMVIPAQFTKAWVFSEGVAAVEHNGELKFINSSGRAVISKGFEVSHRRMDYLFHNGHCFIGDKVSGLIGAIDTLGNWILEPQFKYVMEYDKLIHVQDDEYEGLYTDNLDVIFPMEYSAVDINTYHNTILVRKNNEAPQLYDMELNLLEKFVIDEVHNILYYTGEMIPSTDEYGEECLIKASVVANCKKYCVGGYYTRTSCGLMSKSGEILTQPIYSKIEAIAPNRYLCHPHGVILDDKGRGI